MNVPLLDLKAQYDSIREEIDEAVHRVLESQHFILGPEVEELEREIADYCQCDHAIGVSSGTDALLVALMAIGVKPGDEVITTPYTFFATAGAVARLGAKPVFADIDPASYNLDPGQIEAKITCRTRAIIPVHLYGRMADMDSMMAIARRHDLCVVEDAAQAIGAENKRRRAGSIGHFGCFSFFPSKNLGAFGDGGMVTTNDPALADKVRLLRNHGYRPKYYNKVVGGNFRLDAIQAAVLRVKLRHLDAWTAARQRNAARYSELFRQSGLVDRGLVTLPESGTGVSSQQSVISHQEAGCREPASYTPTVACPITQDPSRLPPAFCSLPAASRHIHNQYVIRTPADRRSALHAHLKQRQIGFEVYYPVPLHLQECFTDLGYTLGDFPHSEAAAAETTALPIYPELTESQLARVVTELSTFFDGFIV
jgi:dTDP-4-amino-4,6-dideoxygalactose transaminase